MSSAVGRTRLRIGEGIIGMVAASGDPLNLADAQNHPRYVYRAEIGEEDIASMLAMPVKRAGRILGVIAVMTREARPFAPVEVEAVATVAMLLAEILVQAGAPPKCRRKGSPAPCPAAMPGTRWRRASPAARSSSYGATAPIARLLTDDPAAELERLDQALDERE